MTDVFKFVQLSVPALKSPGNRVPTPPFGVNAKVPESESGFPILKFVRNSSARTRVTSRENSEISCENSSLTVASSSVVRSRNAVPPNGCVTVELSVTVTPDRTVDPPNGAPDPNEKSELTVAAKVGLEKAYTAGKITGIHFFRIFIIDWFPLVDGNEIKFLLKLMSNHKNGHCIVFGCFDGPPLKRVKKVCKPVGCLTWVTRDRLCFQAVDCCVLCHVLVQSTLLIVKLFNSKMHKDEKHFGI